VGWSPERLGRLVATLKADVEKGTIRGAVLLVARHGKVALFEAVGSIDPQTKAPMTKDAISRIYSMSKPITSVTAMTLVEDDRLGLWSSAGPLAQIGVLSTGGSVSVASVAEATSLTCTKPDPETTSSEGTKPVKRIT
jgi:hypothetical protein